MNGLRIPPEAQYLEARGLISFKVKPEGPAPAWSEWVLKQRQFEVNVHKDLLGLLDEEEMTAVLRHELAHILLGHCHDIAKFNAGEKREDCNGQDLILAADVAVNWWLSDEMRERIESAIKSQAVNSREVLQSIGFDGKNYIPYQAVHERFHELADKEELPRPGEGSSSGEGEGLGNFCGGFQGEIPSEDWARSSAIGSILATKVMNEMKKNGELKEAYGGIGSNAGNFKLYPAAAPTLPWVNAVQEFARSIVRTVLAERASHTRPQQALKAMGVHAPSMKPRWATFPDTVCLLVDTSGSMMNLLGQVLPAIEYLTQHDITVRLIAGDTVVTTDVEVGRGTKMPELVGGGGTDILPLFESARAYTPRAIVAFTDGYVSSWPSSPYDKITTLWVTDFDSVPYGRKVGTSA